MESDNPPYTVHSIHGLPAGVWGESYVIVTASEPAPNYLRIEFFILTKRPKEALHSGVCTIFAESLPPELDKLDLKLGLDEGLLQAEVKLTEMLRERAIELSKPEIEHRPFELKLSGTGYVHSCWRRGQFKAQIKEISETTQCQPLRSYLHLLTQAKFTFQSS